MGEGGYVQNDCVGSCIGSLGDEVGSMLSSWWTRERQVPISTTKTNGQRGYWTDAVAR